MLKVFGPECPARDLGLCMTMFVVWGFEAMFGHWKESVWKTSTRAMHSNSILNFASCLLKYHRSIIKFACIIMCMFSRIAWTAGAHLVAFVVAIRWSCLKLRQHTMGQWVDLRVWQGEALFVRARSCLSCPSYCMYSYLGKGWMLRLGKEWPEVFPGVMGLSDSLLSCTAQDT